MPASRYRFLYSQDLSNCTTQTLHRLPLQLFLYSQDSVSYTHLDVYKRQTLDNIFGILIGKCTFYPEEYRAAKASYTAQEFNLLNDLNNLTVPTAVSYTHLLSSLK